MVEIGSEKITNVSIALQQHPTGGSLFRWSKTYLCHYLSASKSAILPKLALTRAEPEKKKKKGEEGRGRGT